MNTPPRMQSASITGTEGGRRDSAFAALPTSAEPRTPVLPSRGASRQLELPFLAQPKTPLHRLRTG